MSFKVVERSCLTLNVNTHYLRCTHLSVLIFSVCVCACTCVCVSVCVYFLSPSLVGLFNLNLLELSGNLFSAVPRHLPTSVQQLYMSSNTLPGLDKNSFGGFLNLKYLRLSHCSLQSSGIHQQVFNFSSLVELDLSYNKLKTIPTVPTTLQYLYLEANEIQGEVHTYRKKENMHIHTDTNGSQLYSVIVSLASCL